MQRLAPRPALTDLSGKTIGELWGMRFRGNEMLPVIEEKLRERCPGVKFVTTASLATRTTQPGLSWWRPCPPCCGSVGATRSSLPLVLGGAARPRSRGPASRPRRLPVVALSVITSSFVPLARSYGQAQGAQNLAIAEYPGVPMTDSEAQLRDHVANVLIQRIIDGFATPLEPVSQPAEPGPTDIVFKGILEEVKVEARHTLGPRIWLAYVGTRGIASLRRRPADQRAC